MYLAPARLRFYARTGRYASHIFENKKYDKPGQILWCLLAACSMFSEPYLNHEKHKFETDPTMCMCDLHAVRATMHQHGMGEPLHINHTVPLSKSPNPKFVPLRPPRLAFAPPWQIYIKGYAIEPATQLKGITRNRPHPPLDTKAPSQ